MWFILFNEVVLMAFLSFLGRQVFSMEGEYIGVVTDLERNPLTGDSSVVVRVEVADSQVEFIKFVPKDFRVEEGILRLKRRVKIPKGVSSIPKIVGSVPTGPQFPREEKAKRTEPSLPTVPEVSDEENFCPSCGVRTVIGTEQNIPLPRQDNWEERFEATVEKIGVEMEKAFVTARRELESAYNRVKESIRKPPKKDTIFCTNCGEKTEKRAKFCPKCGTALHT